MTTRCEQNGQIEIGIIEHEAQEFVALGATVVGRSVTGYTFKTQVGIELRTWCGRTMLACRCEVAERYWSDTVALVFGLTNGRFIVGYGLADHGMLFRGELVTDCSWDEARREARRIAEAFADLDAEDEAAFLLDE